MPDLVGRVAAYASRYCMFQPGETMGVAVSAGADSVALLLILRELGRPLHVLHCAHGLRGEESEQDVVFVTELAARLDLPCTVHRSMVVPGDNVEQSARNARLESFRDSQVAGMVHRIATGHTLDDQAETVLFRFLRGSHTAGLSGIRPVTTTGLVRPLLDIRRAELRSFLTERGQSWREDSTNSDTRFRRNELRHGLLPQLEAEWNPQLVPLLARHALLAQGEEEYWGSIVAPLAAKLFPRQADGSIICVIQGFPDLAPAVMRRLLREAFLVVKGDLHQLDARHIEGALPMFQRQSGVARLQIPGLDLMRSFDLVRIARWTPPIGDARFYEYPIAGPGTVDITDESRISLEILDVANRETVDSRKCQYNETTAELDAERVIWPLLLRAWRPGDAVRTEGAAEAKKIKFLFQEHRVPLWERRSWPVLECSGGILWTRLFGVAGEYAPTPATRRVLRVTDSKRCPTT